MAALARNKLSLQHIVSIYNNLSSSLFGLNDNYYISCDVEYLYFCKHFNLFLCKKKTRRIPQRKPIEREHSYKASKAYQRREIKPRTQTQNSVTVTLGEHNLRALHKWRAQIKVTLSYHKANNLVNVILASRIDCMFGHLTWQQTKHLAGDFVG